MSSLLPFKFIFVICETCVSLQGVLTVLIHEFLCLKMTDSFLYNLVSNTK